MGIYGISPFITNNYMNNFQTKQPKKISINLDKMSNQSLSNFVSVVKGNPIAQNIIDKDTLFKAIDTEVEKLSKLPDDKKTAAQAAYDTQRKQELADFKDAFNSKSSSTSYADIFGTNQLPFPGKTTKFNPYALDMYI